MGGFGSGRWDNYAKKRTVEDCWVLDLDDILLDNPDPDLPCGVLQVIRINGNEFPLPIRYDFVEEEEGPYLDITYPRGTRYAQEQVKERLTLLSTRPNYGGARWYFSCPFTTEGERCNRRVRILYLPPEECRFGCRECHALTYESTQTNHKYDSLYALLAGASARERPSTS